MSVACKKTAVVSKTGILAVIMPKGGCSRKQKQQKQQQNTNLQHTVTETNNPEITLPREPVNKGETVKHHAYLSYVFLFVVGCFIFHLVQLLLTHCKRIFAAN